MIHIAVCEDNVQDMHSVLHYLNEYDSVHPEMSLNCKEYYQAEDLMGDINEQSLFAIYILDIMMPEMSGIDLGKLIRQNNQDAIIIYITSSKEHALDAFGVLAQRYLLKPIDRTHFFEALDHSLEFISKQDTLFPLKTSQGIISIPHKTIVYVECSSRSIHVYTSEGTSHSSVLIRRNFETEIEQLLSDSSFVQTHKSFTVNMEHVQQYHTSTFLMDSGATIPVARKRQSDVKKQYLKFLGEFGQ